MDPRVLTLGVNTGVSCRLRTLPLFLLSHTAASYHDTLTLLNIDARAHCNYDAEIIDTALIITQYVVCVRKQRTAQGL